MYAEDDDVRTYLPVVNDEEQYSIWLEDKPLPARWREAGPPGTRKVGLDRITEVWTDMRPLSLRRIGV